MSVSWEGSFLFSKSRATASPSFVPEAHCSGLVLLVARVPQRMRGISVSERSGTECWAPPGKWMSLSQTSLSVFTDTNHAWVISTRAIGASMVNSYCLLWSSCTPPLEISLPIWAPPCFSHHSMELVSLRTDSSWQSRLWAKQQSARKRDQSSIKSCM